MELDREAKIDGLVIALLVLYGIAVVGSEPIMAIATWLVAGIVVLKHAVEPFGDAIKENRIAFGVLLVLIMLAAIALPQWL